MNIAELKRRAEEGSCAAQSILGLQYLYGSDEIAVDYEQAHRFLSTAANCGASRAIANLAEMYARGLGVPKDVPRAIQLYERVGKVEFFAAVALGRIYSKGIDVPTNAERALQWYSVAAEFEGRVADCEAELEEAKTYVKGLSR